MRYALAKLLRRGPRYKCRSSVTGHYVSRWYAITHPRTTTRELISN